MAKPHRKLPELTPQEIEYFWSKVDKTPGQGPKGECWEWQPGKDADGYGMFPHARYPWKAHRVAYKLQYDIDPGESLVCHTCDNPPCCYGEHLFTGAMVDNVADMKAKGRMIFRGQPRRSPLPIKKGTSHPSVELTCQKCGSFFKANISCKRKYCSRACYDDVRAQQTANCERCGKPRHTCPSKRRKLCRDCYESRIAHHST